MLPSGVLNDSKSAAVETGFRRISNDKTFNVTTKDGCLSMSIRQADVWEREYGGWRIVEGIGSQHNG
jgi:hypothetical protein